MNNFMTQDSATDKWMRPWDVEVFDEYARDNRFFSIVIKGLLSYLDSTIRLYGKPVHHFIVSTGKEYLYQESNGYNFQWGVTTGEDYPYFHKPRGVIKWEEVSIETQRLSSPFAEGFYERAISNTKEIKEYTAQIRLMPLLLPINITYILSNLNESIVMVEQLLSRFAFTRYFRVSYLGKIIDCSIEFPDSLTPAKTIKTGYDAESKDRQVELKLNLRTVFPVILETSEVDASKVITSWVHESVAGSDMEVVNEK